MNSTETTTSRGMDPRIKNILVMVGIIGSIVIGALLIYGILVTPQRQPYRDALAQFENVGRANATLTATGASLNASTATGEEFEKNIQTAQAALKSLKTENEALGKEEVLQSGEGKEKYDAYNNKLQEYMAYNDNVLASMLKVRPVLFECNRDMTDLTASAESITALRTCSSQLGELKDVPDADYKELVANFQDDYDNLANILEEMAALKDPDGADASQNRVLVNQRNEATTQLSATGSQFTKNVQQSRSQILTTDTEKKLADYLKVKSRIF